MTAVRLAGIVKRFGEVAAARIERLDIAEGEIVSLLGPSGCGKTTTLRIVAGLVQQDEGDLFFGERNMNEVPPERRNAAMVFQNYALFPHMTVFDNIAFGLVVRKVGRQQIERRVREVLDLVQLPGMGDRLPKQLSGGQQQRIAIARALATAPDVLLFDEPLSNLDAKLREYMRLELRKLLEQLRITTVYVTHDQLEAMVISDRIVVMDKGSVVQVDTPREVYRNPASRFVADFLGLTSFVPAVVREWSAADGRGQVVTEDGLVIRAKGPGFAAGDKVLLCIRPENVRLLTADERRADGDNWFEGTIQSAVDLGEFFEFHLAMGRWPLRTKSLSGSRLFAAGEQVAVRLDPEGCTVVPA